MWEEEPNELTPLQLLLQQHQHHHPQQQQHQETKKERKKQIPKMGVSVSVGARKGVMVPSRRTSSSVKVRSHCSREHNCCTWKSGGRADVRNSLFSPARVTHTRPQSLLKMSTGAWQQAQPQVRTAEFHPGAPLCTFMDHERQSANHTLCVIASLSRPLQLLLCLPTWWHA